MWTFSGHSYYQAHDTSLFLSGLLNIKMICLVFFFHHVCIYKKDKPATIVPLFFFFLKKSDPIGFEGSRGKHWPRFQQMWATASIQWDGSGTRKNSRLRAKRCVFGSHLQIFPLLWDSVYIFWPPIQQGRYLHSPLSLTTWFSLLTMWFSGSQFPYL